VVGWLLIKVEIFVDKEGVIKFGSEEKTEGLKKPLDKAAERACVSSQLSNSTVCETRKQAYETEEKGIQFSTTRKAKISPPPQ
jgi:hypothetical protein